MNEDHRKAFVTAFSRWFQGNIHAVRMCLDYLEVAHAWDDVTDGDNVSWETLNRAFAKLALEIPTNPFWQAHANELLPVLRSILLQWKAANAMEAEPHEGDLEKTYMLRASIYQMFAVCAYLCGGQEWAEEIGPEVWRLYGEKLPDLKRELNNA